MPNDSKSGQPNLALIEMVQNARMLHDESARPSDYSAVYWIEAKRKPGDFPPPSANAGEWRVFLHADEVDAVWERVKAATVAGQLGYKSKVSTRPAAGQTQPDERLLCARTYDAGDEMDVARVAEALREMGLTPAKYVADKPPANPSPPQS